MSQCYSLRPGDTPLLISFPHIGTRLPDGLAQRLTPRAQTLSDTDWYVDQLYSWAAELGCGSIQALYSRTVIDLNRPADDKPLYDSPSSGLCPINDFDGNPLYLPGLEPEAAEIAQRTAIYWQPYHLQLASELKRLGAKFGYAILVDAHSIRSRVPRLFENTLPDINLGTNDGQSADDQLTHALCTVLGSQQQYSWVLNGRFKGGFITRNYGRPQQGMHCVQIELAQHNYMQESPPGEVLPDQADCLSDCLKGLIVSALKWRP